MDNPHKQTSDFIRSRMDLLSEAIVESQYNLEPEVWKKYGEAGRLKSVRDTKYHLSYLAEALSAPSLSLFTDYVSWLKVLFAELGFPGAALATTLKCIRDELVRQLPENLAAAAKEYLDEVLKHLEQMPSFVGGYIRDESPLADLAGDYLKTLLRNEHHAANQIIQDAVRNGVNIKDIYLQVFQRTQYEIGRLWQTNRISVAQEHYCTSATQLIMSQLYPYIFSTERNGLRMVATCVGDELHEIGVRMVADFFEMDGWDTFYLGANTPKEGVLKIVADQAADILAVSATMTFHISAVRELIRTIRSARLEKYVRIMVGGYPFNIDPNLWRKVEADGYARDAQEAIYTANSMIEAG